MSTTDLIRAFRRHVKVTRRGNRTTYTCRNGLWSFTGERDEAFDDAMRAFCVNDACGQYDDEDEHDPVPA